MPTRTAERHEIVELTSEELRQVIDREARAALGMDIDTFLAKMHADELQDSPAANRIRILAQLLAA